MNSGPTHPTDASRRQARAGSLRLAGSPASPADRRRLEARDDVRRANLAASRLDEHDARLIMAARVSEALDGGQAALLRPERRRNLVRLGSRLGIRPFDANLIIAVVQDSVRRGESLADIREHDRLGPIPHPALVRSRRSQSVLWRRVRIFLAAASIAGLAFVALTNWLAGG